jgi:hypothetical protein
MSCNWKNVAIANVLGGTFTFMFGGLWHEIVLSSFYHADAKEFYNTMSAKEPNVALIAAGCFAFSIGLWIIWQHLQPQSRFDSAVAGAIYGAGSLVYWTFMMKALLKHYDSCTGMTLDIIWGAISGAVCGMINTQFPCGCALDCCGKQVAPNPDAKADFKNIALANVLGFVWFNMFSGIWHHMLTDVYKAGATTYMTTYVVDTSKVPLSISLLSCCTLGFTLSFWLLFQRMKQLDAKQAALVGALMGAFFSLTVSLNFKGFLKHFLDCCCGIPLDVAWMVIGGAVLGLINHKFPSLSGSTTEGTKEKKAKKAK